MTYEEKVAWLRRYRSALPEVRLAPRRLGRLHTADLYVFL